MTKPWPPSRRADRQHWGQQRRVPQPPRPELYLRRRGPPQVLLWVPIGCLLVVRGPDKITAWRRSVRTETPALLKADRQHRAGHPSVAIQGGTHLQTQTPRLLELKQIPSPSGSPSQGQREPPQTRGTPPPLLLPMPEDSACPSFTTSGKRQSDFRVSPSERESRPWEPC